MDLKRQEKTRDEWSGRIGPEENRTDGKVPGREPRRGEVNRMAGLDGTGIGYLGADQVG